MIRAVALSWLLFVGCMALFVAPYLLSGRGRRKLVEADLGITESIHKQWARSTVRWRLLIATITVVAIIVFVGE